MYRPLPCGTETVCTIAKRDEESRQNYLKCGATGFVRWPVGLGGLGPGGLAMAEMKINMAFGLHDCVRIVLVFTHRTLVNAVLPEQMVHHVLENATGKETSKHCQCRTFRLEERQTSGQPCLALLLHLFVAPQNVAKAVDHSTAAEHK